MIMEPTGPAAASKASKAVLLAGMLFGLSVFDGCDHEGSLNRAFKNKGIPLAAYDMLQDPAQDVTTREGKLILLDMVGRLVPNSCLWLGVPCSWWTAVNGHHFRDPDHPAGDTTNPKVRQANAIARFVADLIKFAHNREIYIVVEKPANSYLWRYKPMKVRSRKWGP